MTWYSRPRRLAAIAADSPDGPAPIISTSRTDILLILAARGVPPAAFGRRQRIHPSVIVSRSAEKGAFRRSDCRSAHGVAYRVVQEVRMKKEIVLAALLSVLVLGPSLLAQQAKTEGSGSPDLVAALKATPGCLGVETARTASGKQVIFAWFENKKALLDWYYSPAHQQLMTLFPTAP